MERDAEVLVCTLEVIYVYTTTLQLTVQLQPWTTILFFYYLGEKYFRGGLGHIFPKKFNIWGKIPSNP